MVMILHPMSHRHLTLQHKSELPLQRQNLQAYNFRAFKAKETSHRSRADLSIDQYELNDENGHPGPVRQIEGYPEGHKCVADEVQVLLLVYLVAIGRIHKGSQAINYGANKVIAPVYLRVEVQAFDQILDAIGFAESIEVQEVS